MFHTSIGSTRPEWAGKPANEIRAIGAGAGSILVIPVGSIEQHGNHLPVATDTILVDAMVHTGTERVVDELPVLVTPPVWSGFSPHHLSLGGTLSLDFDQLRSILETIALTGIENGFDAVLYVNGHGGNAALIDAVVSTVGRRTDAEVLGTTYFQLATDRVETVRDSDVGGMAHGGEFETSLMQYLRDDLVGPPEDREAQPWNEHYGWCGQDLLDGGSVSVYRPFEAYSETGAIGAPKLATPEKGEQIYEIIGEELAALLIAISEHNR